MNVWQTEEKKIMLIRVLVFTVIFLGFNDVEEKRI